MAAAANFLRRPNTWRLIGWGAFAAIMLLPWLAMQVTDEVNWTASDFVFAAVVLGGAGLIVELAAKARVRPAYRAGAALAVLAAVLMLWINGAVGVIGSEQDPANLMYRAVLAIALIGSLLARFRAAGMARAMAASAAAVMLVGVIALATRAGAGDPSWPLDVIGLTGGFAALWLGSAWLFRRAAG